MPRRRPRSILDRNWHAVEETANALLEQETLSGVALDAVLSTVHEIDARGAATTCAADGRPSGIRGTGLEAQGDGPPHWPIAAVRSRSAPGAPRLPDGEASWRLEQPPPPAGARFKVPLGTPDDMEFYAPNEGLLSVEGNAVVPNRPVLLERARLAPALDRLRRLGRSVAHRLGGAGRVLGHHRTERAAGRLGPGAVPLQGRRRRRLLLDRRCSRPTRFARWTRPPATGRTTAGSPAIGSEDPVRPAHRRLSPALGRHQPDELLPAAGPRRQRAGVLRRDVLREHVRRRPGGRHDRPRDARHARASGPILIHELVGDTFAETRLSALTVPRSSPAKALSCCRLNPTARDLWFSGGGAASGPAAPQRRLGARARRSPCTMTGAVLPAGPDRHLAVRHRRPLCRHRAGARHRRRVGCRPGLARNAAAPRQGQGRADRRDGSATTRHAARLAARVAAAPSWSPPPGPKKRGW